MKKIVFLLCSLLLGSGVFLEAQEALQQEEYPMDVLPRAAFKGSSKLKKITLPSVLKEVEAYAFEGCSSLQQIVLLPQGPSMFQENAFPDQEGLCIYVPTEELKLAMMAMFHFCKTELVVGMPTGLTTPGKEMTLGAAVEGNVLTMLPYQSGLLRVYSITGAQLWQGVVRPHERYILTLDSGVYLLHFNNQVLSISISINR